MHEVDELVEKICTRVCPYEKSWSDPLSTVVNLCTVQLMRCTS